MTGPASFAEWTGHDRDRCRERCAEFGDPPCFEVEPSCSPCADCLDAAGAELPEPLDPDAAVGLLL